MNKQKKRIIQVAWLLMFGLPGPIVLLGQPALKSWQAQWITSGLGNDRPMPLFRKVFRADKKIKSAVVYFCGLGYGDLYLNGVLVDPSRMLDPAQTNYEQYALYTAFDITTRLKKGANCLGVLLGNGFYGQDKVWGGWAKYGNPIFILQLELTYADGTRETLISDRSWQWHESPVIQNNVYAGEAYDARKEIKGWSLPGTSIAGWNSAVTATGVIPKELRLQKMNPVRMQQELRPVKMWKTANGNYIFDFEINSTGIPQITVKQPRGTRLTMRMGELLNKDSTVNFATTGVFATGVVQTDEYICAGAGTEIWHPRFTYHGYRYLELSGAATVPHLNWLKMVTIHSDLKRRGLFVCADQQINRLHELAVRTALSNIQGLPVDCPQREKCGWLGDAHTVAPFENLNFEMKDFWEKYLEDIHSSSAGFEENTLFHKYSNALFYWADKPAGLPYMVAPGRRTCGVASPDWGTAVVQLPWQTYLYYGDAEILRKYYPAMKQWVAHIETLSMQDSLKIKHIVPFGLGDWCPPGGNKTIDTPIPLSATAFHYLDAGILQKTAAILGHKEDQQYYSALKTKIAHAFVTAFYDHINKTFGSQTADALALDFGLVPPGDEKAVSAAIVRNMKEKYHNFLHTGIFGMGRIGKALSRFGNAAAAYNVFTKKGAYSFEYMWASAGATSLWEILPISAASKDSCLREGTYSLNHPMLGAYDAWFYEDVAGICPDESGPGFKVIRYEPTMMGLLAWAKASIETPYGKAESNWKNENGKLIWKITIPPNASGCVALPKGKAIRINGKSFGQATFPVIENKAETILYRFPSGRYEVQYAH
ncbi:alpha-L-rhamnosidase [Niabella ginsenosidivorans]|nr:alpha-L-rhamnosidase [Niabella ginsenosidivorans]